MSADSEDKRMKDVVKKARQAQKELSKLYALVKVARYKNDVARYRVYIYVERAKLKKEKDPLRINFHKENLTHLSTCLASNYTGFVRAAKALKENKINEKQRL
ncbi:hypothetical protein ES703_85495 [subsurface metagenome]